MTISLTQPGDHTLKQYHGRTFSAVLVRYECLGFEIFSVVWNVGPVKQVRTFWSEVYATRFYDRTLARHVNRQ